MHKNISCPIKRGYGTRNINFIQKYLYTELTLKKAISHSLKGTYLSLSLRHTEGIRNHCSLLFFVLPLNSTKFLYLI